MNAVRVEPTPAACSRQQMCLLRCRLRRDDEVSNCRLPCSLPRGKLCEFVSRVARRRALAWLRETIRVHACTHVIMVHDQHASFRTHGVTVRAERARCCTRHQPRTRAAASYYSTTARRQVQTEGARGAGPGLTRRITTPWQHQRLVRELSQARAAAV